MGVRKFDLRTFEFERNIGNFKGAKALGLVPCNIGFFIKYAFACKRHEKSHVKCWEIMHILQDLKNNYIKYCLFITKIETSIL